MDICTQKFQNYIKDADSNFAFKENSAIILIQIKIKCEYEVKENDRISLK